MIECILSKRLFWRHVLMYDCDIVRKATRSLSGVRHTRVYVALR
jgi:hypothetical protein